MKRIKLTAWQIAYIEKAVKEYSLDVCGKLAILEILSKVETINIQIKSN